MLTWNDLQRITTSLQNDIGDEYRRAAYLADCNRRVAGSMLMTRCKYSGHLGEIREINPQGGVWVASITDGGEPVLRLLDDLEPA